MMNTMFGERAGSTPAPISGTMQIIRRATAIPFTTLPHKVIGTLPAHFW